MKVSVDGVDLFELSDIQKKVIMYDIPESDFEEDMKRRLQWVITHKYEQTYKRLREEWEPKLSAILDSLPTKPDVFASLVFSQPDYKDRAARIKDEAAEE